MSDTLAPSPSLKISWIVGIAAALLIFVVIAGYSRRMAQDGTDYDRERGKERYATLAKLRAADQQTLTTADWVDPTKNTVRIPIDEAMPETVAALKTKPVQMGAAIPGAAPTMNIIPAAAPNGAPANAPNAVPAASAAPVNPPAPAAEAPNK